MVTVRRVRFPVGTANMRALAVMSVGSVGIVALSLFLTWWAATGRDGGRPAWWVLLVGPIAAVFAAAIALGHLGGLAMGLGLMPAVVVKRRGDSVELVTWNLLKGRVVARFELGDRVPIEASYFVVTTRRKRTQHFAKVSVGAEGNRIILAEMVRGRSTDWSTWAKDLCGDDLIPDLVVVTD